MSEYASLWKFLWPPNHLIVENDWFVGHILLFLTLLGTFLIILGIGLAGWASALKAKEIERRTPQQPS